MLVEGFQIRPSAAGDCLFIAGKWQDHVAFQRVLHREPPESSGSGRR